MQIGLGVVLAIVIGAICVAALFEVVRKSRKRSQRVEQYEISLEEHEGFRFVELRLKAENGTVSKFQFDPRYSHVLSDELCTASARAVHEAHALPI